MLSSTDIYIVTGALTSDRDGWTLRDIADLLHVDHTLVHRALRRAGAAGLYMSSTRRVNRPNFEELVTHAVRFIAPVQLGELTRGVPAAWSVDPISTIIHQQAHEHPPVWPHALGAMRGQTLEPLHPAAIEVSRANPVLGVLLSIIDSLRAGDMRVRQVAANLLHVVLAEGASPQAALSRTYNSSSAAFSSSTD
ncbi:MAG TPA: hypothetical protein VHS55_06320 [Solirubrobacteraceae bacterium]|nr:hypothetical protein [Solirubrobacteraceae bacterium]